ncbi:MAG: hypothetical protein ACI8PQ_000519 [Planctomycetota bacterium]
MLPTSALVHLDFLENNGTFLEFGSDAAFLTGCPDYDEDASVVQVNDSGGLNLPNGLVATPGSLQSLGNPSWCLDMDDQANACGITPSALSVVFITTNSATFQLPGFGCAPGSAGEIMIDPTSIGMLSGPIARVGPGQPATHCFAISADPAICGLLCFGQGVFLDRQGPSGPGVLTNRIDAIVGS